LRSLAAADIPRQLSVAARAASRPWEDGMMVVARRTAFALALVLGVTTGLATAAQAQMVYHRGNSAEPETLDQHLTSTVYEANILRDLYESLVVHGPEAEILPGAAAGWTVSDDGLVYTFQIRDDAQWSNGDDLTAGDFVFSYRRILDPATGAKYANILYPIAGAEAVNKGEAAPETVGVRAVEAKTLEITLESPTPYFLELLTHQTSLPVHPPSVEAHGMGFTRPENMVSNGAYTLVEWVPNAHIKLAKNDAFHAAADVAIDEIYYYPTEDRSAALRRFMAGTPTATPQPSRWTSCARSWAIGSASRRISARTTTP